ncbi:MAG: septal ring lytic transglycosylase RlpA family protein [Spirochaetia bacterium]|nr:septal ring lytic transglycosylase RlpA family protein [Spirochaetia bacterium]
MRRIVAIAFFPIWVGCATTTIHTGTDLHADGRQNGCPTDKADRGDTGADEKGFFAAADDSPEKKAKFEADLPADSKTDKTDPAADSSSKSRDVVINNVNGKPADSKQDKTSMHVDGAGTTDPKDPKKDVDGFEQSGTASWYGRDFDGKRTASGEVFDSRKLTAAHRTLPLGTQLEVKNLENGRETVVVVNDRGPYVKGRIVDMSERAAEALGYKEKGLTTVRIRVIAPGEVRERFPGATESFYADAADNKKPRMADVANGDSKESKDVVVPKDSKDSKESGAGSKTADSVYDRPAVQDPGQKPVAFKDPVKPDQNKKPKTKTNRVTPEDTAGVKKEGATNAFAVQVGIFSDLARATEMKKTLSSYGKVHILKRGEKYVVKVGHFKKKTDADALKSRLSGDGINGFVSSNI